METNNKKYYKLVFVCLILIIISIYVFNRASYYESVMSRQIIPTKKRLQILHELYNIIVNLAEENNIKIFIIYGTLLGKIRNNDIICYDFDLDFGVNLNDYELIRQSILKAVSMTDKYIVEDKKLLWWKAIALVDKETGINADIMVYYNNKTHVCRSISDLYAKYILNECNNNLPIDWLYPLQKSTFLGRTIYLPNKPNKILECHYGNDYLIPNHTCNIDCSVCVENKKY
jgi:phosphorylcholine metabolism protein LicD